MLGLFPASGALGGSIASQLVGTCNVPAKSLTFIARHPAKLDKYKDQGVTVRQADYDAHETLVHAFDGVDTLCLISYASIQNDHRFESHKRAIDAARASGVKHILYTSLAFAGPPESTTSVTQVMQAHLRTEAYLREVAAKDPAFTYTVVREGLYTESFGLYTAFFSLSSPTSPIRIPHDGSAPGVAWAKLEDLGEATARVLVATSSSGKYKNELLLLTGERVLSLSETVSLLGTAAGLPSLHIERVSPEEYAKQPALEAGFASYGGRDKWALPWSTAWEGIRRGETAHVTQTLREVLGREPEPAEVTLREMGRQARGE
ncbi:NmrA-like family protein [Rhodotorula diobovata]|uniref:NmrA-like family protein n=1 Tax=Rhodotorula diobovata TaxID=5288 RepID=A0A5C5G5Z5_9BASI|nr:NmrA-like family protein [Rhodotorula diobovata]